MKYKYTQTVTFTDYWKRNGNYKVQVTMLLNNKKENIAAYLIKHGGYGTAILIKRLIAPVAV